MRVDEREPFSMGGASIIVIISTVVMSIIIVFMLVAAYKTYKMNQEYITYTQAYYAADGEATIKRALIEEQLYKLYFSEANIKYDLPHIIKVTREIKGIEIIELDDKTLLIQYEEPINETQKLNVELSVASMETGLTINYFTEVLKWQVQ